MLGVNWSKTKKAVELVIERYINICLLVDDRSTSEINDNFILNSISVEDCILTYTYANISIEDVSERIEFINYVRAAFNKLTTSERKIIHWTYFDKEHCYDDRFIANELGYSLGYYYIQKKCTLIRFAFALGVEEV